MSIKRFNLLVADNARLRKKIDSLLKERAQFNAQWTKMIGQLTTGKMIINDLIEQATVTFNQRDEELNKIHALRERSNFIVCFWNCACSIENNHLTVFCLEPKPAAHIFFAT